MVHDALILLGELGIWVGLLMSGWCALVSLVGSAIGRVDLQTSGRRAFYVAAVALVLAVAGLVEALVTHEFTLAYVAHHSSVQLSPWLSASAVWAGPAGGMLVAACLATLAGSAVVVRTPQTRPAARFIGVLGGAVVLVLAIIVTFANPYTRLSWLAGNGAGLAPRLRHVAPALARPCLLAGYAAGGLAAAMGAAGLAADAHRRPWMRRSHRWALVAWTLVSLGVLLALRGAYLHTAIAGLWWPAPELTSAALVWLVGTIAIHLAGDNGPSPTGRVGESAAHLGVAIVLLVLLAGRFSASQSVLLQTGQAADVHDTFGRAWHLVGQGVSQYGAADHGITAVSVDVAEGGANARLLVPRLLQYGAPDDSVVTQFDVEPALVRTALGDLRLVPESVFDDSARVRVSFVPGAWLFWLGGLFVVVGGAAAVAFGARSASPSELGA